jgi:hypothetical protein
VFAIIGLSLTLIMVIWGIVIIGNPRSISFDEVGGAWILYGIMTMAIAIVGTAQAFQFHNKKRMQTQPQPNWNQPPYGNPYPPQQPYNQGYPPYPPQQGQPPYPPSGYPPYPPQQGQPPYPPPPPPGQAPWTR